MHSMSYEYVCVGCLSVVPAEEKRPSDDAAAQVEDIGQAAAVITSFFIRLLHFFVVCPLIYKFERNNYFFDLFAFKCGDREVLFICVNQTTAFYTMT